MSAREEPIHLLAKENGEYREALCGQSRLNMTIDPADVTCPHCAAEFSESPEAGNG